MKIFIRCAGISHTSMLFSLSILIIVELKNKMSMNSDKVLKWLSILGGPIGWSIAGIYYAELLRRQYCEIRRSRKRMANPKTAYEYGED